MKTCYARLTMIEDDRVWTCDVCRAWCEGPCDGMTDEDLAKHRAEQLELWENNRGEPNTALEG